MQLSDQGLLEVSEILASFNTEEIRAIVNDQIMGEEEVSAPSSACVDHFHPLYVEFRRIVDSTDNPDVLDAVNRRFIEICDIFVNAIEQKYCVSVDRDWIDEHYNEYAGLVTALYSFFVLNHQDNVEEVLYNYIIKHLDELYKNFENLKAKKDASTLNNRRMTSPELSVIFANIYDVCNYILDRITPMEFMDCMDSDYLPLVLLKKMYDLGYIGGVYGDDMPIVGKDFTDCIAETFRDNTSYKGVICFEVLTRLRRWADAQGNIND